MSRNPRSVYGTSGSSGARAIYGTSGNCHCTPTISPFIGLTTLMSVVSTVESLVRDFFNPTAVMFPLSASMSVAAYIPVSVGVRLIWKYENPGIQFDRTDKIHRLQIKSLYLAMNREQDWNNDVLYSLSGASG